MVNLSQKADFWSGAATIRAYGKHLEFQREALDYITQCTRIYAATKDNNQWIAISSQSIAAVIQATIGLYIVLGTSTLSGGTAGLALLYATATGHKVLWAFRHFAFVISKMPSAQRVISMSQLRSEHFQAGRQLKISRGNIHFSNVTASYDTRNLSPAIQSITFDVKPGVCLSSLAVELTPTYSVGRSGSPSVVGRVSRSFDRWTKRFTLSNLT